ncbi:MAG: SAM-dependent chlorinase/fluorinase [Rhodospirillales bacterium]|jgi:S-adenosylmethionine hydrolase|nr:SAM-dependent chlorinase/fluorinase [Rhodospirillales bacterium]
MIVLFTDFGVAGPYVGQIKAVLARQAPRRPVIELFSDAPACDPKAAAYLLAAYTEEFPVSTIFLAVVDPGVGGPRGAGVLFADGRWFVGPENGLFEIVARRARQEPSWREIFIPGDGVSATFHGRDVFAPAAAVLARGGVPDGCERPVADMRRSTWPDDLAEVIYIDGFGNAMTGLRAARFAAATVLDVGKVRLKRARTFSDVPAGAAFFYDNANGLVEIAVNRGHAADRLGLKVGTPVKIAGM